MSPPGASWRARLRPLDPPADAPADAPRRDSYDDDLAEEAPLALWVNGRPHAVLMCTPTDALDLAAGFLWTEGVIEEREDLAALELCARGMARVTLAAGVRAPEARHRAPLSSSCGLCSLRHEEGLLRPPRGRVWGAPSLSAARVRAALRALDEATPLFAATGGSHGALLCDSRGAPRFAREDVGRHNAVDKALGAALRAGEGRRLSGEEAAWGLAGWALVVTSRAGFEVARKAGAAGVSALISVGAATGLTHRFCEEAGVELISFARPRGAHRHASPR